MIRLAGMRLCNGARQTAFSSAVAGLSAVSDGHWFDLAETAMTLKKPAMVLIDVDGTLVDSVPDLAFCVDEMMRQLGRPVRGEAWPSRSPARVPAPRDAAGPAGSPRTSRDYARGRATGRDLPVPPA